MNELPSRSPANSTGEPPLENPGLPAPSLEAQLAERTEELRKARQELETFAHAVSHDLRAPLRAISGFGRFLAEEYGATLDEQARSYLSRMTEAAAQMNSLFDDLLLFAHAARSQLRRRPLDLSALARQIADTLDQAGAPRRVDFTCMSGLRVSGDERLIRVLLTNLLGNAWKYTGKVAEPQVEMGRLDGAEGSFFFIHDNGAGFDVRYAERLFGMFQRLHSAAEFEGRGMGLATAQRVVQRHGGRIWAETKLNEGSTFCFTLPDAGGADFGRQSLISPVGQLLDTQPTS